MKAPNADAPIMIVTKVKHSNWRIPRIDEEAHHQKYLKEEAERERLRQGTSPDGRELFRKMLYRIGTQLEAGVRGDTILREVEREVRQFAIVREGWARLLSRLYTVSSAKWMELTPTLFSVILIKLIMLERARGMKPIEDSSFDSSHVPLTD